MQNKRRFLIALIFVCLTSAAFAQHTTKENKKQTIAPAAAGNPVVGSGTPGQITKWAGVSGSSTFVVGDSNIFEDKFGKVGIGTKTPTSALTVQGMIETTLGGYKFPDGTVQTTAFDPNQVVRSINGLTGNITLAAGANITITPGGNTLTIAAANALTGVAHDATLQGNGTPASPLGVIVPLSLSGSTALGGAIITATNTNNGGSVGLRGIGGSGLGAGSSLGIPVGVQGESSTGIGVFGISGNDIGVFGRSANNVGVNGDSQTGNGVSGESNSGVGVRGVGKTGVMGIGNNSTIEIGGTGVIALGGDSSGFFGGDGIHAMRGLGIDALTNGRAGSFVGDVDVQGKLTKTMGTFKIDHPLDPENKYLYHSFVESPDMMNIYNGNITTDQNGDAVVEMPNYFDALNKDFRYQLTVIGTFAQAIIASKMKGNRFAIKTNSPNVEVSWMVTGVRRDAYAEKNRVQVEEEKSERERGYYLHPEVFNQPEEKSIEWARQPEIMQRIKQQRIEAQAKLKKQQ